MHANLSNIMNILYANHTQLKLRVRTDLGTDSELHPVHRRSNRCRTVGLFL